MADKSPPKRRTARAQSAGQTSSARAASPWPHGKCRARIRMYRQGIGDAFLLSLYTGAEPRHILIDCGVLTGTKDSSEWAQRIAEDVARESTGHLHAVVGTHPHWDHLSGFYDARKEFQTMKIEEVWLAWSENTQDPEGREQTRRRELLLDGARMALARLAAAPDAATRVRAAAVENMLAFHGPAVAVGPYGTRGTAAALAVLRELVSEPKYCEPGTILSPKWLDGVRVYVLGPPRDQKRLRQMLGKKGSEMYGLGADTGFYASLAELLRLDLPGGAETAPTPEEVEQFEVTRPFDGSLCWKPDAARADGSPIKGVFDRYRSANEQWREIGDEWLLSAEQLALQLDNVVNNLSLVLAFEFTDTKDVLLFAADAQIGNWRSWHDLTWTISEGGERTNVKAIDLLAKTVFYKVGHHGSHNATMMTGGLEAMSHPDLVAAIPVDERFARASKDWDMPAKSIWKPLSEKTRDRILRSDMTEVPSNDRRFKARVQIDPGTPSLYVDYFLP